MFFPGLLSFFLPDFLFSNIPWSRPSNDTYCAQFVSGNEASRAAIRSARAATGKFLV
jgi:hypothetical protein